MRLLGLLAGLWATGAIAGNLKTIFWVRMDCDLFFTGVNIE